MNPTNNMIKIAIPIIAIICISAVSLSLSYPDTEIISPPVGETTLIQLEKPILSINIANIIENVQKAEKPTMSFKTTSTKGFIPNTEIVYEQPLYTDIIKKGDDDYLRIFVPEIYYSLHQKHTIKDISVIITYDEPVRAFSVMGYGPQVTHEYVIITNSTFYPIMNDYFKDWKIIQDDKINSIIITNLSDIDVATYGVNGSYGDATNTSSGNHWITDDEEVTSSFSLFNDTQAHIRNYLRYCYDTFNTRYVLIIGNKNIIPPRMVCSYAWDGDNTYYNDTSHASDMYYACLHNNLNNDTDSRWMENKVFHSTYDDIDWGFDLCVGRVPIETTTELFRWINKTKAYVDGNTQGNYLENLIVASKDSSSNIWEYPWTRIGDEFDDSFVFLNNQNISSTQWNNLDDYVNGLIGNWDGFQLIYHVGHGGTLWSPYSSSNCNNALTPQFVYSEGCGTADFGTDTSSRMESWMSDDGCAYAGIANSAYGWFVASTIYGEIMIDQMFNETTGNFTVCFCQAHNDAREIVGNIEDSVFGMITKETNFFGDPAMEYQYYVGAPPQIITVNNSVNGSLIYNASPTFKWSISDNASIYWLQLSTDSGFSSLTYNVTDINIYNYPMYYSEDEVYCYFDLPISLSYDVYYARVVAYQKD